MRKAKKILWALLPLLLWGCASAPQGNEEARQIVASIEPLRYLAEQIAGDSYTVTSLVPPGSSPEAYDPTPVQLARMERCAAFVAVGSLGFEEQFVPRLRHAFPALPVVESGRGIATPDGDPHLWLSPRNMARMAATLCDALCHLDTAAAPQLRQRLARFVHRTERIDSTLAALLANRKGSAFLIFHPALTAFARDYGLRQMAIEEEGKEPAPARLRQLIDEARAAQASVVLVQQEFDMEHARTIAREVGARVLSIQPLSHDWEQQMLALGEALAGNEAER